MTNKKKELTFDEKLFIIGVYAELSGGKTTIDEFELTNEDCAMLLVDLLDQFESPTAEKILSELEY